VAWDSWAPGVVMRRPLPCRMRPTAAYRHGAEGAIRWRDREWSDTEHRLRADWLAGEHGTLPWEEVRDAIRDAWDRIRGRSDDDRTHIR